MKKLARIATMLRMTIEIAGVGCGISATMGAAIVTTLAIKLAVPSVVVENTLGNRSKWPQYRVNQLVEMPKLMNIRDRGINLSCNPWLAEMESIIEIAPRA